MLLESVGALGNSVSWGVQALAVGTVIYVVRLFLEKQKEDRIVMREISEQCHIAHAREREAFQDQVKIIMQLQKQTSAAITALTDEVVELSKVVAANLSVYDHQKESDPPHNSD